MLLHRCLRASKLCMPRSILTKSVKAEVTSRRYLRISSSSFCDKLGNESSDEKSKMCIPEKIPKTTTELKEKGVPALLSGKYEIFSEENAPVILDIEEERRKFMYKANTIPNEIDQDTLEEFEEVDLIRGKRGVFDVEQIVDLLRSDGAIDIFVAQLPEDLRYAEHLVIVTGRSGRHRKALAQLVRRVCKKKRFSSDLIPRIEGDHADGSNVDWIAMDLGNIVLHIFARAAREKYDLESLWTLGSQHDIQCAKPDDAVTELLNSHSVYLGDLEPAEPSLKASGKRDTKTPFRDTRT